MAIATANEFGLAISKALGLEKVSRLQIDIKADDITEVTATFPAVENDALIEVVKRFKLSVEPVDD